MPGSCLPMQIKAWRRALHQYDQEGPQIGGGKAVHAAGKGSQQQHRGQGEAGSGSQRPRQRSGAGRGSGRGAKEQVGGACVRACVCACMGARCCGCGPALVGSGAGQAEGKGAVTGGAREQSRRGGSVGSAVPMVGWPPCMQAGPSWHLLFPSSALVAW